MKITESQLRQIIREAIVECYGWPVEKEEHLYGVKPDLKDVNPKDPKNPELSLPKGLNTKSSINELRKMIRKEIEEIIMARELNEADLGKLGGMALTAALMTAIPGAIKTGFEKFNKPEVTATASQESSPSELEQAIKVIFDLKKPLNLKAENELMNNPEIKKLINLIPDKKHLESMGGGQYSLRVLNRDKHLAQFHALQALLVFHAKHNSDFAKKVIEWGNANPVLLNK